MNNQCEYCGGIVRDGGRMHLCCQLLKREYELPDDKLIEEDKANIIIHKGVE